MIHGRDVGEGRLRTQEGDPVGPLELPGGRHNLSEQVDKHSFIERPAVLAEQPIENPAFPDAVEHLPPLFGLDSADIHDQPKPLVDQFEELIVNGVDGFSPIVDPGIGRDWRLGNRWFFIVLFHGVTRPKAVDGSVAVDMFLTPARPS